MSRLKIIPRSALIRSQAKPPLRLFFIFPLVLFLVLNCIPTGEDFVYDVRGHTIGFPGPFLQFTSWNWWIHPYYLVLNPAIAAAFTLDIQKLFTHYYPDGFQLGLAGLLGLMLILGVALGVNLTSNVRPLVHLWLVFISFCVICVYLAAAAPVKK